MIQDIPAPIDVLMPSDEVGIVALQPFIRFESDREPFRWARDTVTKQLAAIDRTLQIANSRFNGRPISFTVFPEYAIPGLSGAKLIDDRISSEEWPNNSIIIGGMHGISNVEYKEICDKIKITNFSDSPESIPKNQWVNCCLIWVKNNQGMIQRWAQLKIRPSWPEMNIHCQDMFCGSSVFVFECKYTPSDYPCRFIILICFDWVAKVAGTTICDDLFSELNVRWRDSQPALDLAFVIQHNTKPNSHYFLGSTFWFLNDVTNAFVQRDKGIVIHANTALSAFPSKAGLGGFSACIFSPNAQFESRDCGPTISSKPTILRDSEILKRCNDAIFREMGECIHAFTIRIPRFVTPDATDRTPPIKLAYVYPTSDSVDPRLPSGPVPGAVKWLNDYLDTIKKLSVTDLAGCYLNERATEIEPVIISNLRILNETSVVNYVNWAISSFSSGKIKEQNINADTWDQSQIAAIEHMFHSLISIGLAFALKFDHAILHCVLDVDGKFVHLVAILGDTHEDCRKHFDKHIPHPKNDSVLVITRDSNNLVPTKDEYSKCDEPFENGLAFIDYQTIINKCREATNIDVLEGYFNGILPKDRRIV